MAPTKHAIPAINLPTRVFTTMSPYPTVVRVVTAHHIALGIESKELPKTPGTGGWLASKPYTKDPNSTVKKPTSETIIITPSLDSVVPRRMMFSMWLCRAILAKRRTRTTRMRRNIRIIRKVRIDPTAWCNPSALCDRSSTKSPTANSMYPGKTARKSMALKPFDKKARTDAQANKRNANSIVKTAVKHISNGKKMGENSL
mmetsp:Transcript_49023/g.129524  ORF Transcript_49023/g.129524 Transcript_49023/m.129524 type:complete len:201 (+) Transcript_49023:527-1129(+)